MSLESNYQNILNDINRFNKKANLIAVSKGQDVDKILALYKLGHRDFGENYTQELIEKNTKIIAEGINDIRWHFLGHLQTNKVKTTIPIISFLHSLDSFKLAQEIQKRMPTSKMNVFIEVNIDQETSKSGILPDQVLDFYQSLTRFSALKVLGLMSIPNSKTSTQSFQKLIKLGNTLSPELQYSMGMSEDYKDALQLGSDYIRVGTALFGTR